MTTIRAAQAVLVALALAAAGTPRAQSSEAPPPPASKPASGRPKVVLVLSGGGARGSAHVGVIKKLEEYHIPIDMIVGTSMGSIVGGLYASGWSSEEIQTKITTIDWGSVFVDRVPRPEKTFRRKEDDARFLIPLKMRFRKWKPYIPPAVVGGQNLDLLMQSLEIEATGETDFDRLPIPYRAVAADLATGDPVVLDHGSLAAAMRASMALPGIFPPVEIEGKSLADGGVAANFPIRIARQLGAQTIVGVDITSPLRTKEQLGNLLTRIDQVTGLLTNANRSTDLEAVQPQDVIITPDLGEITFSDFDKGAEAIRIGEQATEAYEGRLRALAVSDDEWNAYIAHHHRRAPAELVVDKIEIRNTGPLSDAIVKRRLEVPVGHPLDEEKLRTQITRLSALDVFGTIHHEFKQQDGQGVLTVDAPPKPYGRNSLQFGFFVSSDFRGEFDFDLTVNHLFNPINRMGGEWRNIAQLGTNSFLSTEYYQPLDTAMAWAFRARLATRQDLFTFFDADGAALAQYTFHTSEGSADFSRTFGRWGRLAVGAFRSSGNGHPRIGPEVLNAFGTDDGGLSAEFLVETLDPVTWPREGTRAQVLYHRSLTGFGAPQSGDFGRAYVLQAFHAGRNVVSLLGEASVIFNGAVAFDTAYPLGGFLHLSGLSPNQLLGSRGGFARVMYYRELSRFSLGSLSQRMYAGVSAEVGNAYNTGDVVTWPSLRRAGSLFVGADTVLGPAYIGYGYEESGRQSAYVVIGQRF